ncbi:MAG: hypothetical protein V9G08_02300 [Dermatophilaceae bacterium]
MHNEESGPHRRRHGEGPHRGPGRGGRPAGPPFGQPEDTPGPEDGFPGPGGMPFGPRGRGRGRRGGPFGRPGGWQQADLPSADDAAEWFTGRLPQDWFVGAPNVTVDREEIVVVGELPPVDGQDSAAAADGRISRFREQTREDRIVIALEAQARFGRKVSWGARIGSESRLFTHLAVPVMTRLRQPQRQVLDTLVDAGVARSRSDALAWAVTLVGEHTQTWLADLRAKMAEVDQLRSEGPTL